MRSPPDLAAAEPRPRGATMSVHQGASEESTFWLLACSGALLSQRSVLVAARCVLDKDTLRSLQPAQVRVVLGTQYQASTDRLKTLHHLRVRHALLVRKSIESFVLVVIFSYVLLHNCMFQPPPAVMPGICITH